MLPADWTKEDEEQEAELIQEIMAFLAANDAKNIKRAAAHARPSLKEVFKEEVKEISLGVIPGVSMARNLTKRLDTMLRASFASGLIHTNSCTGHQAMGEAPYNYLSNLFVDVLNKTASQAEKEMFTKHFASVLAAVGGAAAGTHVGAVVAEHAAEAVVKVVVEPSIDKAGDLVADQIVDVLTAPTPKTKVSLLAWAVYLAGAPRTGHPTVVENCRLALRVILGAPCWQVTIPAFNNHNGRQFPSGDNRFFTLGQHNWHAVSPRDVCELLWDSEHKNNAMIHGDPTKSYARIWTLSQFGKVEEDYDNVGHTVDRNKKPHAAVKVHITHLLTILGGLGLKHCAELGHGAFQLE